MTFQHVLRGEGNSSCREEIIEVHTSVSFDFEEVWEMFLLNPQLAIRQLIASLCDSSMDLLSHNEGYRVLWLVTPRGSLPWWTHPFLYRVQEKHVTPRLRRVVINFFKCKILGPKSPYFSDSSSLIMLYLPHFNDICKFKNTFMYSHFHIWVHIFWASLRLEGTVLGVGYISMNKTLSLP